MSSSNSIFLQYDFSTASAANGVLSDLSPNNINANLPYNYMGCYKDSSNRAIPTYVTNVGNPQQCQNIAISNNASVYGVQYGGQCFIGNNINQAKEYGPTSNCPTLGGTWTNQVYYAQIPLLNQAGPSGINSLKSAYFNASQSQYIPIPAFTTPANGMTFSFWFKTNNNSTMSKIFDFGNSPGSDDTEAFILNGYFGLAVFNQNISNIISNVIPVLNNTWYHIVWSLDTSGVWNVYLNGNLYIIYNKMNYPRSIVRNNNYLGKGNWSTDPYYSGNIADFRIFSNVLSAASVTNLYSSMQPNSNNWVYVPSIGNPIKLFQNNYITQWQNLTITSNANMSVSFIINLQNVNPNWRNIFHVTNDQDCCAIGQRIPALWVTAGQPTLLIVNDTISTGNNTVYTGALPLNTPTRVDIIWSGKTVKAYFNQLLNVEYTYNNTLTSPNPNAAVWIADKWYINGGFTIQDLTFYNGPSLTFKSSTSSSSSSSTNTSTSSSTNSVAYTYPPSVGNSVGLTAGNIISNWANLNIVSNSNMSVSFTINIQNLNSNWRNILHITNTNNDCCNSGDRVLGVWISNGNQTKLLIVNDIQNGSNSYFYSNSIPLNTDTKVDIVWKGQNVNVYFNGILNSQNYYNTPLIEADEDANVYLCDGWYSTGGFTVKDFTFYNGQSISSITSSNTSSGMSLSTYTPSLGKFIGLTGGNIISTWADLNIASNSNMSLSFTINIQSLNSDWRNIVHITNTNNNGSSGGRVPGVWISYNNQTTLYIENNTQNGSSNSFYSNPIPFNTDTEVDIVWKGQNIKVFFNGILNNQYDCNSPLLEANANANVYVCDPWYSTGGFTVKNFSFYNGSSIQISTTEVYNYIGCYNDNSTKRAISTFVGNVNNIQECQDFAISNSNGIYGIQGGNMCFIDNNIESAIQYGEATNCPQMGGNLTNQVYSAVPIPQPTYNYVGCYNDSENSRAIVNKMSDVISVYDCETQAIAKGYTVYGLQANGQCFGSSDINAAREYGLQNDQTQCTKLGGTLTNQIYTNIENVPPLTNINPNMPNSITDYDYKGCYNNKDNSAIPTFRGNVTTLDECSQLAMDNGDYIFGVTNGKCYSGNNIDQALGQGENNASAYCGTLGSANSYQVYIRNSKTHPIMFAANLSSDDFSRGSNKESFSNLNDNNINNKYLSIKILIVILIIILATYMLYNVI